MVIACRIDGKRQDIGNTVAFLCSDRAANITGQVVAVDGGIVLGRPPLRA
jgi:enoyl-[acyl-carrier-protein] reductase (NADH)